MLTEASGKCIFETSPFSFSLFDSINQISWIIENFRCYWQDIPRFSLDWANTAVVNIRRKNDYVISLGDNLNVQIQHKHTFAGHWLMSDDMTIIFCTNSFFSAQ